MSELRSLTLNGQQYDCFVDGVARSMVMGTAMVESASGENIVVLDASNFDVAGLRIFGKTTQDGTPTPDAPVPMASVGGSGSLVVNVSGKKEAHSVTIPTPNGLPGIPVTSGGNYIDPNGQRWIGDEIDFFRGVYVQRVGQKVFDGSNDELWNNYVFPSYEGYSLTENNMLSGTRQKGYCDKLPVHKDAVSEIGLWLGVGNNTIYAHNAKAVAADVVSWRAWLSENPITIYYVLATPVETPLSEEELAAYAALHTYRDSTTVSNDAGAYMELEYAMDAKKYIDSLLKASGWIANVSLPASAWKGTKSPWYQVVQIPGVTENSQVDLTPDVSQLAIFHDKDLAFVAENEDGVVTVYAVGQKPTNDYVIQATIKEVL